MWHSEDYSEPFDLDHIGKHGLCYRCHMIIHCRFNSRRAFNNYARFLAMGRQFMPMHWNDWEGFKRDHLVKDSEFAKYRTVLPRSGHIIDRIYHTELDPS